MLSDYMAQAAHAVADSASNLVPQSLTAGNAGAPAAASARLAWLCGEIQSASPVNATPCLHQRSLVRQMPGLLSERRCEGAATALLLQTQCCRCNLHPLRQAAQESTISCQLLLSLVLTQEDIAQFAH